MPEKVTHQGKLLAIIVRHDFHQEGIEFFTPDEFSQQLAYMKRPKDYRIAPHVHNKVRREVLLTQEVLLIKSGRIRIDFYDDHQQCIDQRELAAGDVVLLAEGGHGLEMLEESEIIEVKQGPYAGDKDKTIY